MRDETCSVDAIDVAAKPAQLTDEIGSLMDECFRTAVQQFEVPRKSSKLGGDALESLSVSRECLR